MKDRNVESQSKKNKLSPAASQAGELSHSPLPSTLEQVDLATTKPVQHQLVGNPVRSVLKALDIIDCLARAQTPLSLQELANELNRPKSTLHGLLAALRLKGYVQQTREEGRYYLGTRLFELGQQMRADWEILNLAGPLLRQLAATTGQTSILAIQNEDEALVLDAADPGGHSIRLSISAGTHLPLYCTAVGKVLLAFRTPSDIRQYYRKTAFLSHTPHTFVRSQDLQADLDRIVEQQLGYEDGEFRIGLRGVAAPIFDSTGCRYAIGISGLFRRLSGEPFLRSTELVRSAAKQLSQTLKSHS